MLIISKERTSHGWSKGQEPRGRGDYSQGLELRPNQETLPTPEIMSSCSQKDFYNFYGQVTPVCLQLLLFLSGSNHYRILSVLSMLSRCMIASCFIFLLRFQDFYCFIVYAITVVSTSPRFGHPLPAVHPQAIPIPLFTSMGHAPMFSKEAEVAALATSMVFSPMLRLNGAFRLSSLWKSSACTLPEEK